MSATADLQLAAYLVTLGHRLTRVEGSRGRRVFVFGADADGDALTYFQDSRPVSARKLFGAYRDLKKLVFESA